MFHNHSAHGRFVKPLPVNSVMPALTNATNRRWVQKVRFFYGSIDKLYNGYIIKTVERGKPNMKNYIRVCVCLDEETKQALEITAKYWGLSNSEAIRRLISLEARKHGFKFRR